jgi:hypothetical protein
MPVEQLAQLLLHLARTDAALPRRTPANDDARHAQYVDDMFNRIEALPELRRDTQPIRLEPHVASRPVPAAAVASNEDLEELVAIALTSAQDAEDVSRDAKEASRRARRGMIVAVGLAVLGIVAAGAAAIGTRQSSVDNQQMAEIARQVQALGELQRHINDQLAEIHAAAPVEKAHAVAPVDEGHAATPVEEAHALAPVRDAHTAAPVQEASAAPATQLTNAVPPELAPLKATPVRVLPAEAAAPLAAPGAGYSPASRAAGWPSRQEAPATSGAPASPYASASSYAAYPPPLASQPSYAVNNRAWTPYHHRHRQYRVVVVPQPVAYVFSTVRRDVGILFR